MIKADNNKPDTFNVLGVPISIVTPDLACDYLEKWAQDTQGRFVCVRDVASLMAMRTDDRLRALHYDAAMITPDGSPIAIIGKMRGLDVERTCGPDLFLNMMRRSVHTGLKHFFYGGKEGIAETLREKMEAAYPGVQIVGTHLPPFRALTRSEQAAVVQKIKDSGADIVWVGISSPKQDLWMHQTVTSLTQTLVGVGAAFDFHSGAIARAPEWMQKSSLEWLHRLMSEPKRLWRRYLILAPIFLILTVFDACHRSVRAGSGES